MVLNECRQAIARGFSVLEKERLSDAGIAAVCDIRKAAGELFEQASNYEDALMLFNRLTKSVVDDSRGSDVFANPFWDLQEQNRHSGSRNTSSDEPMAHFTSRENKPERDEEEPSVARTSIRGSGRLTASKTEARDALKDEVKYGSSIKEPMFDALYEEEVEPEAATVSDEDVEVVPAKDTTESFANDFKDRFEFDNDLSQSLVDDYHADDAAEISAADDLIENIEDLEEDDLFIEDEAEEEQTAAETSNAVISECEPEDEQGVFDASELPEYAISYADDPYLLADDFVENLDDEDMELFIQMGQEANEPSEDIVRPGSLEKHGPKEEPKQAPQEAVENARDKFYMPARSRIAMIRGVEPEDNFNNFDLLSAGYKNDEPTEEYDSGIPTEDELRNAESEFVDEPEDEPEEAVIPIGPSAIMEKVEAPENEERDEADPSFDDDTLGINIQKSLLMDDDEYEHSYKVDMITTIAEQDAQAESYRDRMEALASVSFDPTNRRGGAIPEDEE
jgi:hypothetical protein